MKLTPDYVKSALCIANSIVKDCVEDYEEPSISEIKIYPARSFWGQITYQGGRSFSLKISKVFEEIGDDTVAARNRFMSTLVHELLHTVRGCMNHGSKWKMLASAVNRKYPDLNITRCTSMSQFGVKKREKQYRFQVICHKCGYSYMRQRKSETTDPYFLNHFCRCGNCGGRTQFEVKQLIGGSYVTV